MSHLDLRVVASQLHSCSARVEIRVQRLCGASLSKAQCDWPPEKTECDYGMLNCFLGGNSCSGIKMMDSTGCVLSIAMKSNYV